MVHVHFEFATQIANPAKYCTLYSAPKFSLYNSLIYINKSTGASIENPRVGGSIPPLPPDDR